MKKSAVIKGLRSPTDVIDNPEETDVDVNSYYNSNRKYVPSQHFSIPTPKESVHIVTSK